MQPDNFQIRTNTLVAEFHAYNAEIANTQRRAQDMARGKSWVVGQLRQMMTVPEVAQVLGLRPPTVYAILNGVPEASEIEDLTVLMERLAEIATQAQHVADGKTPLISPNPVGMQLLADHIRWALEWLSTVQQPVPDVDMAGILGSGQQGVRHPD
jgi:hypothetical protein